MSEPRIRIERNPWRSSVARLTPLACSLIALVSCRSEGTADQTGQKVAAVTLTPEYSKLSEDGTKCDEGSPRPCFQPIRKRPERAPATAQAIMNAVIERPEGARAAWPYEAYNGSAGDPVNVVCQVKGQRVRSSDIWNVVLVPGEHMNNETIAEAEASDTPGYGVVKDAQGKVLAAFGFAPDMWFGNHGIYEQLAPCTPAQNPANHPTVK